MNEKEIIVKEMEEKYSELRKDLESIEEESIEAYEEANLETRILRYGILGEKIEKLVDKHGNFIIANKEYLEKNPAVGNLFNLLRQEVINHRSNANGNHNILLTKQKIEEHEKRMEIQSKRIMEHDKNMLNIMGAFLAIFSLIGVNFSFFSKVESADVCELMRLILVVNLSLVIAIMVVFGCIKWLFMNNK